MCCRDPAEYQEQVECFTEKRELMGNRDTTNYNQKRKHQILYGHVKIMPKDWILKMTVVWRLPER